MNMFLIQLLITSNIHRLGRLSMIKTVKEQAIRNPETFRWDLFNIFPAPLGKTQGLSSLSSLSPLIGSPGSKSVGQLPKDARCWSTAAACL